MSKGLTVRFRHVIQSVAVLVAESGVEAIQSARARGHFVLVYVTGGELTCESMGDSESNLVIGEDQALILGPGNERPSKLDTPTHATWYALEFSLDSGTERQIRKRNLLPCNNRVANPEGLLDAFRQYARESMSPVPCRAILDCLASMIVSIVVESPSVLSSRNESGSDRAVGVIATQVDSYIAAHFSRAIDAPSVAEHLCYNSEYLERTYRRVRGISISSAIRQRRAHEACVLLINRNDLTISEVGELCGYTSSSDFGRAFKRVIGRSPSEFRANEGAVT